MRRTITYDSNRTARRVENNTEASFVSLRTAKRAQRDIEFVCRQIARFAKMSFDEYKAYLRKHPDDAFCNIRRPDGNGHLPIGGLAWKRLGVLAELALSLDPGLGGRVGRQRARSAVTEAFSTRFLHEAREVNEDTAELVIQDALAALRRSLVVTEHYFPSVLFADGAPDEFRVGPITFVRRRKFFKDRKSAFRISIEAATAIHIEQVSKAVARGFPREKAYSETQSRDAVRGLQAQAIKIYRCYPWVAIVRVTDCDGDTSKERAVRAVEMALQVVRVILGAVPTRKPKHAWSRSDTLRTAHLYADTHDVIHASIGTSVLGPAGAEGWHEALMHASYELNFSANF